MFVEEILDWKKELDNKEMMSDPIFERAKAIAKAGSLEKAIESGTVPHKIKS